jgi:hypothetical protein
LSFAEQFVWRHILKRASTATVLTFVPEGAKEGNQVQVTGPSGALTLVTVPAGVSPGTTEQLESTVPPRSVHPVYAGVAALGDLEPCPALRAALLAAGDKIMITAEEWRSSTLIVKGFRALQVTCTALTDKPHWQRVPQGSTVLEQQHFEQLQRFEQQWLVREQQQQQEQLDDWKQVG